VYGWYYDILTGHIEQYDEQARRFLPLWDDEFLAI
jgi:carbonic anhydrase